MYATQYIIVRRSRSLYSMSRGRSQYNNIVSKLSTRIVGIIMIYECTKKKNQIKLKR